jgi:hypothetical protein
MNITVARSILPFPSNHRALSVAALILALACAGCGSTQTVVWKQSRALRLNNAAMEVMLTDGTSVVSDPGNHVFASDATRLIHSSEARAFGLSEAEIVNMENVSRLRLAGLAVDSTGVQRRNTEALWCLGERRDSTGARLERFTGFIPRERIASIRIDDGAYLTSTAMSDRLAGTYTILLANGTSIEAKDIVFRGESLQCRDADTDRIVTVPDSLIHSMSTRHTLFGFLAGLAAGTVAGLSGAAIVSITMATEPHAEYPPSAAPLAVASIVAGVVIGPYIGITCAPRTEYLFERVESSE